MNDIVEALARGLVPIVSGSQEDQFGSPLPDIQYDDLPPAWQRTFLGYARAILPIAAEHFAGVAENVMILCAIGSPDEGPFTRQDRTVDEARAQIAAAIRAAGEPTP